MARHRSARSTRPTGFANSDVWAPLGPDSTACAPYVNGISVRLSGWTKSFASEHIAPLCWRQKDEPPKHGVLQELLTKGVGTAKRQTLLVAPTLGSAQRFARSPFRPGHRMRRAH